MDQESWLSCEKTAILQGGFLLANKLCHPASLSALQKDQWGRVSHPILQAVQEICRQNGAHWRKKVLCILWSKLLGQETGEDMEMSWRENPFFSLQNTLPEVSHTLLLELVKSMEASLCFTQLLLCLPGQQVRSELGRLVRHAASSPASEEDVRLLLEVWWELWKGRVEKRRRGEEGGGGEDDLEKVFAHQFARLSKSSSSSVVDTSPHAAKRFRLDPSSSSTSGVLSILLHALLDLKGNIMTPDLCQQALCITLNSLYTSYLIGQAIDLPAQQKLDFLSRAVCLGEMHAGKPSSEEELEQVIREAQRDLAASHSQAPFPLCGLTLAEALLGVRELVQHWQQRGLLGKADTEKPSLSALRLEGSLHRMLEGLKLAGAGADVEAGVKGKVGVVAGANVKVEVVAGVKGKVEDKAEGKVEVGSRVEDKVDVGSGVEDKVLIGSSVEDKVAVGFGAEAVSGREVGGEQQTVRGVDSLLRGLLESLSFPDLQRSSSDQARIAMAAIDHRLDGYREFTLLFAGELSCVLSSSQWIAFLERNKPAFQRPDVVMELVSSLRTQCGSQDTAHCRKVKQLIVELFTDLSLADKNKALGAVQLLSSRGLHGLGLPQEVTDGFGQELNMAFNCLIQGGSGASASALPSNLSTAVSMVARVAFQNPEVVLRRCCHLAVVNRGAHTLLARILQQLPGLRGEEREEEEEGKGRSLLCRCLQETLKNKLSTVNEEEQFLNFLVLLMEPISVDEGLDSMHSFLSPQEVVCYLVLSHLSSADPGVCSLDLSLRVLRCALAVDQSSSPHWILGCSPFPLLYILALLLHQAIRCWDQPAEGAVAISMETKELLVCVMTPLGEVVGREVTSNPNTWSRALFWLYHKVEALDWTVRFHLKAVWAGHFKNEVPSSLLTVCDLPEQEWSGLELPQYGLGTGLLAWVECCVVSDPLQTSMLSRLLLDQNQPEHVNMFSKGLLVALTQTMPWCSLTEWTRLLRAVRSLVHSGRLHVPYSLEYVDYLPLLDLRAVSCELRLSVLLLRLLQFLCGSSCEVWLSERGWAHVSRLYAHAVRGLLGALRGKLPLGLPHGRASLKASGLPKGGRTTSSSSRAPRSAQLPVTPTQDMETEDSVFGSTPQTTTMNAAYSPVVPSPHSSPSSKGLEAGGKGEDEGGSVGAGSQEVLFVLSQLYCHVQHAQVMMPGGQSEVLFLVALEILSHYESVMATHPDSSSALDSLNARHFFSTITENLHSKDMKGVLQQKIAQLLSSAG